MDYKQKYDNALGRAKALYAKGAPDSLYLEEMFPELKENEDEKIRNALVKYLEALDDEDIRYGVSFKEMRSWLEKQKRHNPLSKDEEYTLARIIEYLEDNGCPSKWKDLLYDVYALPYQKERKPAGWSEEDERMCQETIDWFEKKCFPYALESQNPARESIKWLKSLKQRMKGE